MKITVKDNKNTETEVLVTGDADTEEVKKIVSTLEALDNSTSKNILLKDQDGYALRSLDKIGYVYSKGNKTITVIDIEQYESKLKLYEFEDLRSQGFIRISKGYVINVKYLDKMKVEYSGNYTLTMHNKDELILSRSYAKEFKKYLKEAL